MNEVVGLISASTYGITGLIYEQEGGQPHFRKRISHGEDSNLLREY